jgi:hypothetical protein
LFTIPKRADGASSAGEGDAWRGRDVMSSSLQDMTKPDGRLT